MTYDFVMNFTERTSGSAFIPYRVNRGLNRRSRIEDRGSRIIEDRGSKIDYPRSSILDPQSSTTLALLRSVIPLLPGAFDQRRQVFSQQVAAFDQLQSRFRHQAQIVGAARVSLFERESRIARAFTLGLCLCEGNV